MQLEFHQLDRRWEHLRVREPHRQRRLLASLADSGQQTPIVVVVSKDNPERYLVIDGYKRIAALQQLGRDTVEAVIWPMSEAEALLLDRTLRLSQQETELEQGWLLQEMEQRFGYPIDELARRFDRSASWVSRRLALVELLPEAIQQQVREGKLAAQLAMKYLVPAARISVDDCERMAAAFATQRCTTREAGQLYTAWREGSRQVRERILAAPELFLKTQRQPQSPAVTEAAALARDLEMLAAIAQRANRRIGVALTEMDDEHLEQAQHKIEQARRDLDRMAQRMEIALSTLAPKEQKEKHAEPTATRGDSGTERQESEHTQNRARVESIAPKRTQSAALELRGGPTHPAAGESRTLPGADPRSFEQVQRESRASP
jgi:ParB family transcriptional regulator, chromosome partitioning protein